MNKPAIKNILAVVLMAGAIAAAGWTWKRQQQERLAALPPVDGQPHQDEAAPIGTLPLPDSPWMERRGERYADVLAGTSCEILLVPVQVEAKAFDQATRLLMSAEIAQALRNGGRCVADPWLADRALGEGMRLRDDEAILELAQRLKAKTIVRLYAGHTAPGRMRVTVQAGAPGQPTVAHSFDDIAYSDEVPAFAALRPKLQQVLQSVGLTTSPAPEKAAGSMPQYLPRSPQQYLDGFADSAGNPLAEAARLEFLAMLAPADEWPATQRLFGKAWMVLEGADDNDPAVRRLRARSMLHLRQRPFALATLQQDSGPEAEGLRAVLDGNLPQAREALARITDPWEQLFLAVEVHDLELAYARESRDAEYKAATLLKDTPFEPMLLSRLRDYNAWNLDSTAGYRQMLAQSLPVDGFALADTSIGGELMKVFDNPSYELAPLRHLQKLMDARPQLWCCAASGAGAAPGDLLDLLESRIERTLVQQAAFRAFPQARYDDALETLRKYDTELTGHPRAEALRARLYWYLMDQVEPARREQYRKAMHEAALSAVWWSQGQNPGSNNAIWFMDQPPADVHMSRLARYTYDEPLRSYWVVGEPGVGDAQRLPFSSSDTQPLEKLIDQTNGSAHERYRSMAGSRFAGSALATGLKLQDLPRDDAGIAAIRAEIARDPDNWEWYRGLGIRYFDDDKFSEVRKAVLSYPQFSERNPNDAVTLSGYASAWGHSLLWQGALDDAKPLLATAAGYNTGAASGSYSAARLALLDDDQATAAAWFLEIGRHYKDDIAFRELASLLFAGGSAEAWPLFDAAVEPSAALTVWSSAIVGHRRAGMNAAAVNQWYAERLRTVRDGERRNIMRANALFEQVIDRKPGAELAQAMAALSSPDELDVNDGRILLADSVDKPEQLGPSAFGLAPSPASLQQPLADRYALAAEVIAASQAGRDADALSKFWQMSSIYKTETGHLAFVLPYAAIAAARSGDGGKLQSALLALPEKKRGYEVPLALSILAALGADDSSAQGWLDRSFRDWSDRKGVYFPLSAYEYILSCTLIYEATGKQQYREAALKLARLLRKLEPAQAYAHSSVAMLSTDTKERTEALAMALYLDPQSYWASKAPAEIQAAAHRRSNANSFTRAAARPTWKQLEAALP